MATAAAATPAARAGESSAQATATTSAATAGPVYHVLGGSTAARATGAATGVGCLRGGVGGGRLGLVWVSLHGERQNMSRLESTLCSFLWYWHAVYYLCERSARENAVREAEQKNWLAA